MEQLAHSELEQFYIQKIIPVSHCTVSLLENKSIRPDNKLTKKLKKTSLHLLLPSFWPTRTCKQKVC
jgi:hypothetical protein